jgi:hypothetical protein
VLLATLLAIGLSASPPAVQTALAAGPLQVRGDATYTLDPEAGRVHVAIAFQATNQKPNTSTFIYFYRDITLSIQPEARSVRAVDKAGSISITTRQRQFYVEATVHLRANLYYQASTTFTIRYDLVGGAPRSASPIRVGKAFSTFGVWAWGDVGLGTVQVRTPAGFESQVDGDPLEPTTATTATSGTVLRATPANPNSFYSIVSAENRAAYGSTRISLEGGVEIVVMAWPEDGSWTRTVSDTLRKGLPKLRELIGLDWPVTHDLNVRERFTPSLEGYAGLFFTDTQRIDVSEDLDPVVIVHEASHAWFDEALFKERWIYEGLAQEYAWRVQTAVSADAGPSAERPDLKDPGYVPLVSWTFPEVIRDQKTDDLERYGYGAAFWVIHQVVAGAGIEGMQAAFNAAKTNHTAYVGAGTPELVDAADDWRRLLDLIEPIDQPDTTTAEATIRQFALTAGDTSALDDRGAARDRYRALVSAGNGWLPPWYVRRQMGMWSFAGATKAMAEATTVLSLRDSVGAAAASLGLAPDNAVRLAYEGAQDGFNGATGIANGQLAALAAVADAKAKVDAAPDLVTQLGLVGETPGVPYEAARSAFESGQLEQAVASAAAAVAIITAAPAIGQQRLLVGVGTAVLVLLFVVLLVALMRRRGRRRSAAAFALAAEAPVTLAADPAAAPPPPSTGPPDVEGGPDRDDSPADP